MGEMGEMSEMNRAERRKAAKRRQTKGAKRDAVKMPAAMKDTVTKTQHLFLQEGEKVHLNIDVIKAHPDWNRKSEIYRRFVDEHGDTVFTVEYSERHKENPTLVCLAEDAYKWLWFEGHLKRTGGTH